MDISKRDLKTKDQFRLEQNDRVKETEVKEMIGKCKDCEFCFPHEKYEFVCADAHYGENIADSLEVVKDCFSEGLNAFVERSKKEEILFVPGTKLSQIKIDRRKQIKLRDQEDKVIRIKASSAKKIMPDIEIEGVIFGDTYRVRTVFDSKPFNGGKYLVVK